MSTLIANALTSRFLIRMVCPNCSQDLKSPTQAPLRCESCGSSFHKVNDTLSFLSSSGIDMPQEHKGDSIILAVKLRMKKFPLVFHLIHAWVAGPTIGLTPRGFAKKFQPDALVVNLGSGIRRIDPKVLNVDYFHFDGVDVAADIHRLPFKDHSVDGIICNSVLEHLRQPGVAVREMKRVLKPGGQLYIQTPFIHAFHSSPDDFFRWTAEGLELFFHDFQKVETGIIYGPTSSLMHIVSEWFALFLSFGSVKLYQILNMAFQVLTGPFRCLDLIMGHHPRSIQSSNIIYYVGKA
jgi:SAM-dependent methyltransferase